MGCVNRAGCAQLGEPLIRWSAHQRRSQLIQGLVRGDMTLAETAEDAPCVVKWTLERLHLAECPPRFPKLYFHFASDEMVEGLEARLQELVGIFQRHPGLCVRIEGFGNPSAPPQLGWAVSQARAAATRQRLLRRLLRNPGPRVGD